MKGFKAFILKGNLIDFAVGVIIGAAFGQLVNSLVQDIMMPPISIVLASVSFDNWFIVIKEGEKAGPYATLDEAKTAGASLLRIGLFINALISFVITSFCVYIMITVIGKIKERIVTKEAETTKDCPYCFSKIDIKAVKCPNCTSDIK